MTRGERELRNMLVRISAKFMGGHLAGRMLSSEKGGGSSRGRGRERGRRRGGRSGGGERSWRKGRVFGLGNDGGGDGEANVSFDFFFEKEVVRGGVGGERGRSGRGRGGGGGGEAHAGMKNGNSKFPNFSFVLKYTDIHGVLK